MASVQSTAKTAESEYVPRVSDEEQARRNRELCETLNSFVTEGDEKDQRETLEVLRESLGAGRVASSRNLFL